MKSANVFYSFFFLETLRLRQKLVIRFKEYAKVPIERTHAWAAMVRNRGSALSIRRRVQNETFIIYVNEAITVVKRNEYTLTFKKIIN